MRISERIDGDARAAGWKCTLDAIVLAVALALVTEWVGARAGVVLDPHPGWIAVLVLAARYGGGGLFAGLITTAGAVGIGSAMGGTAPLAAWSRLDSGPNLIAFGACLAVSSVASLHLRRQAELGERLSVVCTRASDAEAAIRALRGVVLKLRARVDRTSTSISFLRDVAGRLEGTDPVAAAEAAADMALARTGACAAAVEVSAGGARHVLAVRDAEGPTALAPATLRRPDVTVSINHRGDRLGAIALWGIPRSGLDAATTHDLAVIAAWSGPAVAVAVESPVELSGLERKVG